MYEADEFMHKALQEIMDTNNTVLSFECAPQVFSENFMNQRTYVQVVTHCIVSKQQYEKHFFN